MITKTLKVSFFVIALASFSYAGAQETIEVSEDKSRKMFKHLDMNEDGKITLEEFKTMRVKSPSKVAQVEKRFVSMDTNKDGTVDKAEFRIFFEGSRKAKQKKQEIKVKKG
ncbi:hypothetical protein FBALC1_12802 [Flavobacteriales bacterium ALC-1]|nr:hypothetical protein FBALC1_12802 [Flavobacteriales bacterium ALC-1]